MVLGEPVVTLRPDAIGRSVAAVVLLGFGAVMVVVSWAGGGTTSWPGSPIRIIPALILAVDLLAKSLLSKVEIAPDRIRISSPGGFREVRCSSVVGVARGRGRSDSHRLLLMAGSPAVKRSRLGGRRLPTWDQADSVPIPAVSIDEIVRLLDLPEPSTEDVEGQPSAAETVRDLRSFFWDAGKPGVFLYALAIAIVLCVIVVIWGTTGGTGPLSGNP